MEHHLAPWWLRGPSGWSGHAQTIWPALFGRDRQDAVQPLRVPYVRERWNTPDGDFIDLDWLRVPQASGSSVKPLLVMFHGLEGSSQSHYARAFAWWAQAQGWDYVVPHFRGCSGEMNRTVRAYHSGDHEEIDWILRGLKARAQGPLRVVGVSLGGNALLRWVQEAGQMAAGVVQAVASISAPLDLAAAGQALGQGLNQWIYTNMFLRSLRPKALKKAQLHPDAPICVDALLSARNLYEYDNAYTAPVHGFANTEDYWRRCSAKPGLSSIQAVPCLVLNARNDPFVPAPSLPLPHEVGAGVTLWQPAHGGHVGFAQGRLPGHVADLPAAVGQWFHQHR